MRPRHRRAPRGAGADDSSESTGGASPLWPGSEGLRLAELAQPRKTATLLATDRNLEGAAVDDALDLFTDGSFH